MLAVYLPPYAFRGTPAPYLWVFYRLLSSIREPMYFLLGQEYLESPVEMGRKGRWEVSEQSQVSMGYQLPARSVLDMHTFRLLKSEGFPGGTVQPGNPIEFFRRFLTEPIPELRDELAGHLEAAGDRTLEGILTWCNCPSLSEAAKALGLPVVHMELGPLRAPLYKSTAYLDFSGVNGNTEAAARYSRIKGERWNSVDTDSLRALFRGGDTSFVPGGHCGVALQVEDDSSLVAFGNGYDSQGLIARAQLLHGEQDILIRAHPGSKFALKDGQHQVDKSANSIEFLARCSHVHSINSSLGLEAILHGLIVDVVGECSYSYILEPSSQAEKDRRLAFYLFSYLVPFELLFEVDYLRFRLSFPSEDKVLDRHMTAYGAPVGLGAPQRGTNLKDWVETMHLAHRISELDTRILERDAHIGALSLDIDRLKADVITHISVANALQESIRAFEGQRDGAIAERDRALADSTAAREARDAALKQRDDSLVDMGGAIVARNHAVAERDAAVGDAVLARAERDDALAERDAAVGDAVLARAERDDALAERDAAVGDAVLARAERDDARRLRDDYARMLDLMQSSRSWRLTKPLRFVGRLARGEIQAAFSPLAGNGMERVPTLLMRVRNALRYIARGDLEGFFQRVRSYRQSIAARKQYAAAAAIQDSAALSNAGQVWGVMATRHTLFIAHIIADRLRNHGWGAEVFTEAPANFGHDWYVVVCPQMFTRLPPGEKRIVYQMEQSVSSRWFIKDYLQTLNQSLAVLEYALVNVEFLAGKGIAYPHTYYLPVGASSTYGSSLASPVKTYDVLFYGDCNSSPRRREMLAALRQEFDVQEVSEVFGSDMLQIIKQARLVINLHYYENALLEMPRIQECLSLGTPIVSESSRDQNDYPELTGAVRFFEQGSIPAMIDAVREALADPGIGRGVESAVVRGAQRFEFMFDRFLVGMGFLPASHISCMRLPLADSVDRVGLSLPETIARRHVFESKGPRGYAVFDGIRRHPGWVGCGLSYMSLAQHATRHGTRRLAVMEDDALLPTDFEEKMMIVHEFLDAKAGRWDVFSGIIASLHSDTKILSVEEFKGITFVTIDKMTSMVFNVYGEKILRLLGAWDPENLDVVSNAIDRYLERQADLRIVVTLPYLVGHREEVHSTLWGFQNTQYKEMIAGSEQSLRDMMLAQGVGVPDAGAGLLG